MTAPLKTHADLADRLALPLSTTIELRKREGWPHVRLGRKVRFTDEQIEQIITTHTTVDQVVEKVSSGLTARSSRRRSA